MEELSFNVLELGNCGNTVIDKSIDGIHAMQVDMNRWNTMKLFLPAGAGKADSRSPLPNSDKRPQSENG